MRGSQAVAGRPRDVRDRRRSSKSRPFVGRRRGTAVAPQGSVELIRVTAFSFFFGFALTAAGLACSGEATPPLPSAAASADVIDPVVGTYDRGTDPAVAVVEGNGVPL